MNILKKVLSAIWKVVKFILWLSLSIISNLLFFIAFILKLQIKQTEINKDAVYKKNRRQREIWNHYLVQKNGMGSHMDHHNDR